jgi:hypothetical protein
MDHAPHATATFGGWQKAIQQAKRFLDSVLEDKQPR